MRLALPWPGGGSRTDLRLAPPASVSAESVGMCSTELDLFPEFRSRWPCGRVRRLDRFLHGASVVAEHGAVGEDDDSGSLCNPLFVRGARRRYSRRLSLVLNPLEQIVEHDEVLAPVVTNLPCWEVVVTGAMDRLPTS